MLEPGELVLVLIDKCANDDRFGRTSLQKVAYLAGAALGWPNLGHRAYHYGPYSRLLDNETNRLVRLGLVNEDSEDLGFVGVEGFAARRFRYSLTADGRSARAKLDKLARDDVCALVNTVDRIRQVAGLDQRVLSLAAKTHFIARQQDTKLTYDQIREFALDVGWRLSSVQIEDVAKKLQELRLIDMIALPFQGCGPSNRWVKDEASRPLRSPISDTRRSVGRRPVFLC
jgi:uncharacterized protein YwgA